MAGLQMRAKARGWRSKFSYTNNACRRGPSKAFFQDGEMLFRAQREVGMTVLGTAEDRDVHISGAQVVIVICVFLHGLDHDCVCVTAILLFYSVGRLNEADSFWRGIEIGNMLTLKPCVSSNFCPNLQYWKMRPQAGEDKSFLAPWSIHWQLNIFIFWRHSGCKLPLWWMYAKIINSNLKHHLSEAYKAHLVINHWILTRNLSCKMCIFVHFGCMGVTLPWLSHIFPHIPSQRSELTASKRL